jgi:hypothetical protein
MIDTVADGEPPGYFRKTAYGKTWEGISGAMDSKTLKP